MENAAQTVRTLNHRHQLSSPCETDTASLHIDSVGSFDPIQISREYPYSERSTIGAECLLAYWSSKYVDQFKWAKLFGAGGMHNRLPYPVHPWL